MDSNEGNFPVPWILYGTAWKQERTADLVVEAIQAGFRAIDTANQLKHYDEARVGEGLARLRVMGIERSQLFLQTKFTFREGQDHRLPYDPRASLGTQVLQSFESSLAHLQTDYLDSYLLHGPQHYPGLGKEDWEVWEALESLYQQGKVRAIGISNVNSEQLEQLLSRAKIPPHFVQNRCFANRGWDAGVRFLCVTARIQYQGFSLLTANPQVVEHPELLQIARAHQATAAQVIFRFASQLGMLPLTGTTSRQHMHEDLESARLQLSEREVEKILHLG